MEGGFLPKVRFPLAEHLCTLLEPSEEARSVLVPGMSASDFILTLAKQGHVIDAIRYLAVGLPRREAVWWTCACRRRFLTEELPAEEVAAWAAAEAWVYEPTEPHRRAAYAPAEALKHQTAGAYAALGVYWSGGSLAPPEVSVVVPPADSLTGSAVAASVILCCVPGPAKGTSSRHSEAFKIGCEIASGGSGTKAGEHATA